MAEVVTNKKNKQRNPEKEMTFWDHLDELRWHLVRSAAAMLILAVVAFVNRRFIFDGIILWPNDPQFPTNRFFCWFGRTFHLGDLCFESMKLNLINYNMAGQFLTHMYTSIIAGMVVATPYIVWEIWSFLKPALKPNERKYSRAAVAIITGLFLLGVSFGYFLIVPLTVNFFGNYFVSSTVVNQIALSSYISTVVSATVASGVVFELPVFVYFLTKVGLISAAFLKRTRKYTLIIILTIAAVITPPDVFSQILVTIPLYGLFEFSIWIASRIDRKRELAG